MSMVQTKVWTLEELHSLPDDGNRYELLHGELFVTPPPNFDHDTIIARLHALLVPFVAAHNLGYVYSNSVITKDESWLIPDLIVRKSAPPRTAWKSAPVPILVVEVLSPTTRRRDSEFKRPYYLHEVGVPEYWIVDGEQRSSTAIRSGIQPVTITDRLTWAPVEAVETLEILLDDVFGPAPG